MTLSTNPDSSSGQLVDDENPEHYINGGVAMVTEYGAGKPLRHWVSAEAFMEVQAERDKLVRTLAFINGEVAADAEDSTKVRTHLDRIRGHLDRAGFTEVQGKAHNDLVRWIRANPLDAPGRTAEVVAQADLED